MKVPTLTLILCVLLALSIAALEPSQLQVPMSDGVELAADLYLPAKEGPHPVILIRTPYSRGGSRVFAEPFVREGYAVLVQDVRGKWGSGGEFVPFVNERKDGLETLDFIASAEWSDGRTGVFGPSYLGMAGLLLADHGHPSLKTVFSVSGWIDGDQINSPGGAFHMMLAIPWLLFSGGQTQQPLSDFDMEELFQFLPVRDVFGSIGKDMPGWNEEVLRAYAGSDESGVTIPVFHMTGWYDFVAGASLDTWRSMKRATDQPQRLVVGPWVHDQIFTSETVIGEIDAGEASILGVDGLMRLAIDWFDCHLRARCTDHAPVRVFVLGDDEWRDFGEWPPRGSRTESFHLRSRGDAAHSPAGGRLVRRPERGAGQDRYRFDPNDPVPTRGGANFHFFPEVNGPRDQREIEARPDVAVYTTEPLARDLFLAGAVRVVLHVSTEGRDTDFTAKLVNVGPDGSALSILDGIIRLSHRKGLDQRSLVQPGEIHEIEIDLGEVAMRIPRGNRLRLDVTSSNFPKFDRNPNTGEYPLDARELVPVTQTIHHGRAWPSRVELTTLAVRDRPVVRTARAETTPRRRLSPTAADAEVVRAGVTLLEAGRSGEAAAFFTEHVKLAPGTAEYHYWSGRALLAEKEIEGAVEAFERATDLVPDRSELHLWLGRALVQKLQSAGTLEKARLAGRVRQSYEKAVELDPSSLEARTSLAGYYLSAPALAGGSTRKAMEQIEAIIAIDPARGLVLLAQVHLQKKEWEEAEAAYRKVLEHDQGNAAIHFQMGRMYQDRERWSEAAGSFEAAIASDPAHAEAWYQLGRTGAMSGENLDRALEAIEIFIDRFSSVSDPAYRAGSWWRKGMILDRQGRIEEAIAAYRRALQIDPSHQHSRKALAMREAK
jgi:uncharacterized protein